MSSPVSYDLHGQGGGIVLEGGDSVTGVFRWIQVLTDTVLDCESGGTVGNLNSITKMGGVTLAAGIGIGGRFTAVNVTTGLVIAYYY
jgi:hypothetical protein